MKYKLTINAEFETPEGINPPIKDLKEIFYQHLVTIELDGFTIVDKEEENIFAGILYDITFADEPEMDIFVEEI